MTTFSRSPILKPAPPPSKTPILKGFLQRKCACGGSPGAGGDCAECQKKRLDLQRKEAGGGGAAIAPPIVHEVLRSPGQPLDQGSRSSMEERFGYDFSKVRVHTDMRAAASAWAVNSLAYTVGQHIVFGKGRYAPGTSDGKELLVHELSHVMQHRGGEQVIPQSLVIGGKDSVQELEAEAASRAVTGNRAGGLLPCDSLMLRRQEDDFLSTTGGAIHQRSSFSTTDELPYRESVNLLECIRIMGPGSERYCREIVLGESEPVLVAQADPLSDISTFQSPGASGWWGAKFGCYRNQCTRRHRGWDVHAPVGTDILAVASGTATHHQDPGGYGDYIKLQSNAEPNKVYWYAHLSHRQPAGAYTAGDVLGKTGTSGNADADRPHLHFELRIAGNAVDPAGYFAEPNQVIEATGSSATAIDKSLPAPCTPC